MFESVISGYRFLYLQLASLLGCGWAIVALSFICSFLMLPLMRAVAGVVRREKEYEDVIDPQVAAIRAKYASDMDRHLHIQALYRRYGYSPLSPIKKVLPLFVQIPFLLLTYYMLKGTAELSGVSFLFLADLGRPDALLSTSLVTLNLLPLVMTGVNVLTVYGTPGFTVRDQVQAVGISILFLILLYTAPSALLLYWTLNNVITMIRTLMADKGAGFALICTRIALLKHGPGYVLRLASVRNFAVLAFVLFLLALYFCLSAIMMSTMRFEKGGVLFGSLDWMLISIFCACCIIMVLTVKRRAVTFRCVLAWAAVVVVVMGLGLVVLARMNIMRQFLVNRYTVFGVMACLICFARLFRKMQMSWKSCCKLSVQCLPLLLVLGVFALHYAVSSPDLSLSFVSVVKLCVFFVAPCIVLSCLFALVMGDLVKVSHLWRGVVGLLVGIYLIPLVSTESGLFRYDDNLWLRAAVTGCAMLTFLLLRIGKAYYVFIVLLSCSVCVRSLLPSHTANAVTADSPTGIAEALSQSACVRTNNVYLLIYDSYAHQAVIDGLGLSDHAIYDRLRQKGFELYDAYSTGTTTLSSMSALFSCGSREEGNPRSVVVGNNVFSRFLDKNGYHTSYLLCGYTMPNRGCVMPGDFYYPAFGDVVQPEWLLYTCILRGILSQAPQSFNSFTHEDWLSAYYGAVEKAKERKFGSFIYAHSPFPEHAPWEKQYRRSDSEEQTDYVERLKVANKEILHTLDLVDGDENAVVIIASDHGAGLMYPNPENNWDSRHVCDHHGVLLSVRWPRDYQPSLKINCLQNVLIEVLICLSGNGNLARFAVDGTTQPMYPLTKLPGYIKQGEIQYGPDAGETFSNAARKRFAGNGRTK